VLKVALTGGIATGKSHVLDRFRELGVACLDADDFAHGVMAAGTEAAQAIAGRFGAEFLDATGAVDRGRLGPVVFADARARRDLEAIVHPAVYRAIEAGIRAFERLGDTRLVIVDVPLLYETGGQAAFDTVIATVCPAEMQLARMAARGMSDADARQRLAAQLPAQEKAARADFVIRTDGSRAETWAQVEKIWWELEDRLRLLPR
jgi:dephospho-CoA kinase